MVGLGSIFLSNWVGSGQYCLKLDLLGQFEFIWDWFLVALGRYLVNLCLFVSLLIDSGSIWAILVDLSRFGSDFGEFQSCQISIC